MRQNKSTARSAAAIMIAAALGAAYVGSAHANWLSRLARGAGEAGEAGLHAGRLGLGALEGAAGYVAKLPPLGKGVPLAAHATPEGHWKFVNREGDVFTAGSADELARVKEALAPGAVPDSKLALYLSEDTVFAEQANRKNLGLDADLHLVAGKDSYRLAWRGEGSAARLAAEVRPNITVPAQDRKLFHEAVFQLTRPDRKSTRLHSSHL